MPGDDSNRLSTTGDDDTPIFVSVERTAFLIGLSERAVYRLFDSGELETVKQGARRMVVGESITAYVTRRLDEARAVKAA